MSCRDCVDTYLRYQHNTSQPPPVSVRQIHSHSDQITLTPHKMHLSLSGWHVQTQIAFYSNTGCKWVDSGPSTTFYIIHIFPCPGWIPLNHLYVELFCYFNDDGGGRAIAARKAWIWLRSNAETALLTMCKRKGREAPKALVWWFILIYAAHTCCSLHAKPSWVAMATRCQVKTLQTCKHIHIGSIYRCRATVCF